MTDPIDHRTEAERYAEDLASDYPEADAGHRGALHALLAIHDTMREIRDRLPEPEGVKEALGCGPFRLATPADLARVGIEPAPADDLPGEPVEPGDLRAGDRVRFTWWGVEHSTCTLVSVAGGSTLRADANDAGDRGIPCVVIRGEWAGGISYVRLIERAPVPARERAEAERDDERAKGEER